MIIIRNNEIFIKVSPIVANRKNRIKRRANYTVQGQSVASATNPILATDYLEFQIGYDAKLSEVTAGSKATVSDLTFTSLKNVTKKLYELGEILEAAYNLYYDQELLDEIINELENASPEEYFENNYSIHRSSKPIVSILNKDVSRVDVVLPNFYAEFDSGFAIEIKIDYQQKASGSQAMVYLLIPTEKLLKNMDTQVIGNTLKASDEVFLKISEEIFNEVIIYLVKIFGMASEAHNHDIVEILKAVKNG